MKGKILGFNTTDGGAISGDDGARYKFTASDWRGEKPPVQGGQVDFDVADGKAIDIYPVGGLGIGSLGGVSANFDSLSASESGTRAKGLLTQSLAVPLALLVLFACFTTAIATPGLKYSFFGLGGIGEWLVCSPSAPMAQI